ncbi:hypothetical protein DFJ74DRAFT_709386 [Hyaloraphidium curvatum]|nr:hypothetical protein DFJ74DRAFT_709386 [Hyaloraphidium curvatum]
MSTPSEAVPGHSALLSNDALFDDAGRLEAAAPASGTAPVFELMRLPPELVQLVASKMDLVSLVRLCSTCRALSIFERVAELWEDFAAELDPLAFFGPAGIAAAAERDGWRKFASQVATFHCRVCGKMDTYTFDMVAKVRSCEEHHSEAAKAAEPEPYLFNAFCFPRRPNFIVHGGPEGVDALLKILSGEDGHFDYWGTTIGLVGDFDFPPMTDEDGGVQPTLIVYKPLRLVGLGEQKPVLTFECFITYDGTFPPAAINVSAPLVLENLVLRTLENHVPDPNEPEDPDTLGFGPILDVDTGAIFVECDFESVVGDALHFNRCRFLLHMCTFSLSDPGRDLAAILCIKVPTFTIFGCTFDCPDALQGCICSDELPVDAVEGILELNTFVSRSRRIWPSGEPGGAQPWTEGFGSRGFFRTFG